MYRRVLLASLACWPAAILSQEDSRPRHKISAATLHTALSARFPLRFGVPGLLELQVSAPQLLLLPARNKLGAALVLEAAGTRDPRGTAGELDLVFDLRWEASDRTIRARHPEVLDIRWPGVPPDAAARLQELVPLFARQALGDVVLYSFSERELAVPEAMGLEPARLEVQVDGLLVLFGPKKPR